MLNFDPLADTGTHKETADEDVLVTDLLASRTEDRMAFAVTLDAISKIAALEPDSESTIHDVIFDSVGEDPEALGYAVDRVIDFAEGLGLSAVAMDDLFSEDPEIAMDELQGFASMVNSVTTDDIDVPTLVTMSLDSQELGYIFDKEVTLDTVTTDWMFSKNKPKKLPKRVGKHRMVTVPCHRTINGRSKAGFCRYPDSLLKGKEYIKNGASSSQRTNLAQMVTDAHTAKAEKRRAKNVKLTANARKGSKSASRD